MDKAVHEQCRGRYTFKSLPPVKAKGYDKPVPILEPFDASGNNKKKKKKSSIAFVGRKIEKWTILSVAKGIVEEPEISHSSMIFLTGESGMGKSQLMRHVLDELKKKSVDENLSALSSLICTTTETEQRIPLRYVERK